MALDEQSVLLRVQAAGDVLGELLHGTPPQVRGLLPHRDGVEVRHEIIAVVVVGPLRPVADRAHIGAERQLAAGLDAREHDRFSLSLVGIHECLSFPLSDKFAHRIAHDLHAALDLLEAGQGEVQADIGADFALIHAEG